MNCKYCRHELEEGNSVCPSCGKDNAEEILEEAVAAEEMVTEQAAPAQEEKTPEGKQPEAKKGITLSPGKLVMVIAAVVVLTAVVVALIMQGMGADFSGGAEETTAPADVAESIATEAPATIPADGNPDDVTCKGSYTVSDEDVIAAADTVVATAGDGQLTNGQLQIYYWMQVQNFLGTYGDYAIYYGMDYTQPLDTQVCTVSEETMTWQQYFLDAALESWHNYQAMANASAAAGYELDETYRGYVDSIPESLATEGGLQGFASAEEYLAYNVGPGASMQDYMDYTELYYQGYLYFQAEYEKMMPTDEEVEAYFTEHEEEYAASGVTRDSKYVDVRHILVLPEGATVDTIYTETFSDEAWAVGEANAQAILDKWLAGDMTEESFAALANEESADPGSNTNGGLYESVYEGQMVAEFEAWCFDASRQVGDYGIVKTDLGYHIMYFSGSTSAWQESVMSDMLSERANAMMVGTMELYPMEVDYEAIKLGFVDMTA